jgi:RHS repeat-associated protein
MTAWGEVTEPSPAAPTTPVRFQGQYADDETGLVYNRARYYDPSTGRFISADPILNDGGLNHFAYCTNPLSWVDPLGLSEDDTLLLGRYMETRVQPAAKVLGAHTYSQRARNPENVYENVKNLPERDPRRKAQTRAALKNQKQWIRDMVKSGRRICDIGDRDFGKPKAPKGDPDFCGAEHDQLWALGLQRRYAGSVVWTDEKLQRHHAPLYEWK